MSKEITKFVLPFSTLSQNRKEPFQKDMEKATIFCLAELDRAKGKGRVLKHPEEKLDFISEVCYPFWLITLDDVGLLFDGLCTTHRTLTYSTIPDIRYFIDNAHRNSRTRKAYMTFLSDNLNYFQGPNTEEEKIINGLITDPEFLRDFNQYLTKTAIIEDSIPNKVTISPTLNQSSITSIMEELQNKKLIFKEEADLLYQSMKLVKAKTNLSLEAIREEIGRTKEDFRDAIQKSKASADQVVQRIREEYNEKVTKISKKVEEELVIIRQEKIKLDKIKKQLTDEIERCETKIRTFAVNKDDVSERKWKEKRDETKIELSETEAKIKEINNNIKELQDNQKLEIFQLKSEYDAGVREAQKNIIEIESSRDAKIQLHKEEMEKLEELTTNIIEQIANLARLRDKTIDQFNKLGIQQQEKKALIYMPFYLVCYRSDSGKRYAPFLPSTVRNAGLSVKFKGALGKTKIKQLLEPRSEMISSILNKFPTLIEQNPVFNREIDEACNKVNILNQKTSIKNGMEKIRDEGWLSDKEFESFNQLI